MQFQAHAVHQDSSGNVEEPLDIVVLVVDQNDNKPAFAQDTFQGEVAEASPIGTVSRCHFNLKKMFVSVQQYVSLSQDKRADRTSTV